MISEKIKKHRGLIFFGSGVLVGLAVFFALDQSRQIEVIKMGEHHVMLVDHKAGTIRSCSVRGACAVERDLKTGEVMYPDYRERLSAANRRITELEKELAKRPHLPDLSAYGTPLHP